MINIHYTRVIPRDLFNEAKLLKCMGQLMLAVLDNKIQGITHNEPDNFKIGLMDEGSLTITNLEIEIHGERHRFKTTYNSKANFPLYVEGNEGDEIEVFSSNGEFTTEFITYTNSLNLKNV